MADTVQASPVKWLYCFACDEPFELLPPMATCGCGRSSARSDGGVLEVRGPAKALAPVEKIVRVDGGEWAPVPEDVFIHRILPAAA